MAVWKGAVYVCEGSVREGWFTKCCNGYTLSLKVANR